MDEQTQCVAWNWTNWSGVDTDGWNLSASETCAKSTCASWLLLKILLSLWTNLFFFSSGRTCTLTYLGMDLNHAGFKIFMQCWNWQLTLLLDQKHNPWLGWCPLANNCPVNNPMGKLLDPHAPLTNHCLVKKNPWWNSWTRTHHFLDITKCGNPILLVNQKKKTLEFFYLNTSSRVFNGIFNFLCAKRMCSTAHVFRAPHVPRRASITWPRDVTRCRWRVGMRGGCLSSRRSQTTLDCRTSSTITNEAPWLVRW